MIYVRALLAAVLALGIDQASKYWIVQVRALEIGERIDVMSPYLTFVMAWNTGINFGLFGDLGPDTGRWILIGLSLAIILALIIWLRRMEGWRVPVSIGLVIGGALGNAVDRLIYGAVVDFLNMSCCGINNPFAFNIADIFIFAGAAGLFLFADKDSKKKA